MLFAQMHLDWASMYAGTYSGGSDKANAIAVDDSGNVYVTGGSQNGSSTFECVTIKYNKYGDSLWVSHYLNSIGQDIQVDDSGNVFVSGRGLIKYNRNGLLIWSNPNYDSTGMYPTGYYKIILDSLGNIYAGGINLYRLTTGKFDKNGNLIWRKYYTFQGSAGLDYFGDITTDKFGNVIITGESKSSTTFYDYATIKYSNDGDFVWGRRYNGPSSNSLDIAEGIAADLSGNIYVTGSSSDTINGANCVTIKYDSAGSVIWIKRIPSSEQIANIGYKIKSDSSQNVFIVGQLNGRTSTFKLNKDGNIIWSRIYPDGVNGASTPVIVLDSSYNVYVTAISTSTGAADYAAVKYDSSGNQIYSVTYNALTIGYDYPEDLEVDKKGNLYLTGQFAAINGNYGTVKFSPNPLSVTEKNIISDKYELSQNYPNPFNPVTKIYYTIPKEGNVKITIYNSLGQQIKELINEFRNIGNYVTEFEGSTFSSGIYYYRIESLNFFQTKKMILLK